ncbi:hypothetical protein LMG28614_01028 [Paraburkholderia ultramafica]|uniref:Uncharacterized protein n=1 Tax=Paraburkholderia ultramafica TaxID=1544867 RepID=A0A6S7B5R1_9BURK|nr:hypothetical protein LMG28614_01028 [Paraburkholderia ultramafica]
MDERQVGLAIMHGFFEQRGEGNTDVVSAALSAAVQRTREVAA